MGGENVVGNGADDEHDVSQEGHLNPSTPGAARIILVRDSVGLALHFENLRSDTSRGLLTQPKTSLVEVCLSICRFKDGVLDLNSCLFSPIIGQFSSTAFELPSSHA